MADRYLLRCPCGLDITIEPRQAGQEVACECGQVQLAPAYSKLRGLPRAAEEVSVEGGSWSFGKGVLTTGLLLAAGLAAGGGYVWATEPVPPQPYSAAQRDSAVAAQIEQATPSQAFLVWTERHQLLARIGFEPMPDPKRNFQTKQLARTRTLRWGLLGASAAVTLASVGAFVMLPDQQA